MTTGTCYFPSYEHACIYYFYEIGGNVKAPEIRALVDYKLKNEEIKIGDPPLKDGQTKKLIDNRWHICE
jgi:hypothetical protein